MINSRRSTAVLLGLLFALSACDSLLEVETAGRIPAEQLDNPANAALLVTGAVADFECAFGAYTVLGGLVGEELVDATQTANRFPYDQRVVQPSDSRYATFTCEELGVYTPLQTARASADNAARIIEGATDAQVPNRNALLATARTFGGYSLVLLGEGFCSGTVSMVSPSGQIVYGKELSRAELFQEAVNRFTSAIAAAEAAGNQESLNTALLGRARALLNLGRYAEARADAARVPASFVRNATFSGVIGRRENRVFAQNSGTSPSVSIGEPYQSINDPRVPVIPLLDAQGRVRRSVTGVPFYRQTKYTDQGTPIPIATGDEARLIIAESDARAGRLTDAIAIINAFRTRGGQPQFTGTTQQAVLNEIIDQRRRELFLESHHLGDVIRYNIALRPQPGTPYHGGGVYGDSKCLPLPDIERFTNPEID